MKASNPVQNSVLFPSDIATTIVLNYIIFNVKSWKLLENFKNIARL